MAGLFGLEDPEQQGLLSAALAMLAASGPSSKRTSVGQVVGLGGIQGLESYNAARLLKQRDEELKRRNLIADMQIRKAQQQELEDEQAKQAVIAEAKRLTTPQYPLNHGVMATDPAMNPLNMTPTLPQFNSLEALARNVPMKAVATMEAMRKPKNLITAGNNIYNADTGQWEVPPAKATKGPQSFEEFLLAQSNPEFAKFLDRRRPQGNSTTVVLPKAQLEFFKGLGEGQSKRANEAFTRRSLARQTEAFVNQMEALDNTGMQGGGPLQGWMQMIQGAAQQLGVKYDPAKLAVDQATQQTVAREVWSQMSQNPAVKQMSNEDRRAFEKTILGQDLNPESRKLAYAILRKQTARDIQLGNAVEARVKAAMARGDENVLIEDLFSTFDTSPANPTESLGSSKKTIKFTDLP